MKRNYIIFISLFLINSSVFSQDKDIRWNKDPRTSPALNPVGTYSEFPEITAENITSKEARHIINQNIVYSVSPNFRVHPRVSGTQSETPLTRHPHNASIMLGSANTFSGGNLSTGSYVSLNSGFNWNGNDTLMRSGGIPIFNFGDPAPAIDKNGRFIISYINSSLLIGTSFSTNNGATWSSSSTIPTSSSSTDKNMTATDDIPGSPYYGRTYTVYTEFNGPYVNRIVSSYTTNGGVSWSAAIPVSPAPQSGYYHLGCDIKVGLNGVVYVVWGNNIINGQNSTEDYLGFAKSISGGTSWGYSTDYAADINGLRTDNLFNGIRCNGFPRIDIDLTNCGSRRGWIYVVTGEKFWAPANGVADIVLNTSTDDGLTWVRSKVNQNSDPNNFEYLPAIRVDETGALNVCYYSTRNSFSNTDAEIYLSTSYDGGLSFFDVLVSDHMFTPSPIPGLASGYQGDYIGITSGNGRIWPYWCEPGITGRYQAWTANVNITGSIQCIKVNGFYVLADFHRYWPPMAFFVTYHIPFSDNKGSDIIEYWSRSNVSAYGIDSGSGKYDSYTAPYGTTQPMESFNFVPVPLNAYLLFDQAYAPYPSPSSGPDSLIVDCSVDGGVSFITLDQLYGYYPSGTLNTAPATSSPFVPTPFQWTGRSYPLPEGTNKIRLRPVSGLGNNIYVDNIRVQVLQLPVVSSIFVIPQGFYNAATNILNNPDSVTVYLHRIQSPYVVADSAKGVLSRFTFRAFMVFTNALSDNYYIRVKHRNSIETWSNSGVSYTRGSMMNYNFTTAVTQAFGNNMIQVDTSPLRFGIYSGDVQQDGTVDATDLSMIDNDAFNFVTGYVPTDADGNNFVDATDAAIVDNNASNFVVVIRP